MKESEIAATHLTQMVNDVDAHTLFEKGGPLAWFSLRSTCTSVVVNGLPSDKQSRLIAKVYEQYSMLKRVSQRFVATGHGKNLASILHRIRQEKPKVVTSEDRSRTARLSRLIRFLHDGHVVHIGHFNEAEALVGELSVENKILAWEQIHSARREYCCKLYQVS